MKGRKENLCLILIIANYALLERDKRLLSVVDDDRIPGEEFFRFLIQLAGNLMDLIFLTADGAAHSYPAAHALYFKFAGAFFALHGFNSTALHG